MSSNDGLNLVAIVAGVRAIVDAVDTALELWHALPFHVDDAGQLEVGDRWTLGANLEGWSHRWALGAWIGGTVREATGHTVEARAALGPFGVFVIYDGGDENDPDPCRCSRSRGMTAEHGPHAHWCPARDLDAELEAYLDQHRNTPAAVGAR